MTAITLSLLLRYVMVGAFNTAFSYGAYCGLLYAGLHYPLASLGALILGVLLSFVTLGRYVFVSQLRGRFHKFLLVWAALYLLNIGTIRLLLAFGLDAYVAGLVAAVPTISLAFLLQRNYVFPH